MAMGLTIGQVAGAGGVNVQTIRYYERRGLFAPTQRSRSGYRQYSADAVVRLRFIRHAQALGFSLSEIKDLLALRVQNGKSCDRVAFKAKQKLDVVVQRIRDLQRLKGTLEGLARACATHRATDPCPILEALADDDPGR
jgi:Hg(II)-responsive transcriptional regulator